MFKSFFARSTPTAVASEVSVGKKSSTERDVALSVEKDTTKKKKKSKKPDGGSDEDAVRDTTPPGGFSALAAQAPAAPSRPLDGQLAVSQGSDSNEQQKIDGPKKITLSATAAAKIGCPRNLMMVPGPKVHKNERQLDVSKYPQQWYAIRCCEFFTDARACAARERGYIKSLMKYAEAMHLVLREDAEPVLVFRHFRALMPHGRAESRIRVIEHVAAEAEVAVGMVLEDEAGGVSALGETWRLQLPRAVAQKAVDAGLINGDSFEDRKLLCKVAGHEVVQLDVQMTEKMMEKMVDMARSGEKLFAATPYVAVTTSTYAEKQLCVKQKFFEEKKGRADCELSAFKLASYLCGIGYCAYAGGTDVHVIVKVAGEKQKLKEHLRGHSLWQQYLPSQEWAQFTDDVQSNAWVGETKPPPPPPAAVADSVANTFVLQEGEEFVVVRSREPLPKQVAELVNAIPGLTFVAKRSERLAFAKAKVDESRQMTRYNVSGRVLFAQRAKEWTADNSV
jgi:hypothetical protein